MSPWSRIISPHIASDISTKTTTLKEIGNIFCSFAKSIDDLKKAELPIGTKLVLLSIVLGVSVEIEVDSFLQF